MQKKWVVANWKMNGQPDLVHAFKNILKEIILAYNVVICPPFPLLSLFTPLPNNIYLGAQNCHESTSGAFTGETSAALLHALGCTHVLIGQSERRRYYDEDDEIIFQKADTAQTHHLVPIVCVGETESQRHEGKTKEIIKQSLLHLQNLNLSKIMVAYEPLWAIGTGQSASVDAIEEVHDFIHQTLPGVPVLYGGSVQASNASTILQSPYVQGILVGGASLKIDDFKQIISV